MLAEEKPTLISTEQSGSTDSTEQAANSHSTDSTDLTDIDSSPVSSQWDRSSLAKLVGLNDEDEPDKVSSAGDSLEDLSSSEPYGGDNNSDADSSDGNVLGDDELFDDPHLKATPKSVAKSPFAKFGLVGGGLGAVFLLAGLLLSGIMNSKGPVKAKVSTPTPTPTVEAKQPQNTEGRLKTELALNSQSDDLKQLDEAKKNQKKQQGVSPTDPKGQKTANGKVTSATPTTAAATTSASSPPPTVYRSSPPPPRVSSPPVTPSPAYRASSPPSEPSSSPKPKDSFSQVAASMPSAPKPSSSPSSTTPVSSTNASQSQVDPVTQWQALASLGSYSATDSEGQPAPSGTNFVASRDTTQKLDSEPTANRFTSGRFTQTSPQTPSSTQPSTPASTTDDGKLAEQRLLDGTPYRVAATGSMAAGVLVTPAILPATSQATSATNASSQSPPRFVVTLSGDLTDTSGQTLMPAGTSLVFEARGIDGNGVMNAVAVSQIDNTGMEKSLPSDALVLTGEKGSPLIAKGYFDNGGTIASMDVSSAVLGALGKVGEILNRPDQQTSSSISGGTVSQTTTSTTGKPNLLGALLEGGASPVLEQIMKRNEQSIQDMQQRKNLWFVKAGTNVQVVVNHSFEL